MHLSSRTAAGRSRSADEGVFFRLDVAQSTGTVRSGASAAGPYAWKRVQQERIWSATGPKGLAARGVMTLLLWHADAQGRVWLGIKAIADKAGAGSRRTIRHALDALVRDGWLLSTSQTWATLTAEQVAAGRPTPRRDDLGQAPNLYVLLDGRGNPAHLETLAPAHPQQSRSGETPSSNVELRQNVVRPGSFRPGGAVRKCQGESRVDLHHDLDPKGSRSRMVSVDDVECSAPDTHHFEKNPEKSSDKLAAWEVLVDAHVDKTKSTYGLPPLPPEIKREQQRALAASLDGAAAEATVKLHTRTGMEHDFAEVRRDLAARVMHLYFKHDNEHLRRVKHALRDLPREFHARLTEAMQALLRESHDASAPRRPQLDQPPESIVFADKPTEMSTKNVTDQPSKQVVSVDKPFDDTSAKGRERCATSSPASSATSQNTAREARRLLDALTVPSPKPEISGPLAPSEIWTDRGLMRKFADKPALESFEPKSFELKPLVVPTMSSFASPFARGEMISHDVRAPDLFVLGYSQANRRHCQTTP